jgi:hypothetical protein
VSPATDFDVFLSHNSHEKPVVERIATKLAAANLRPWLDKWCLTPGGDWQEELAAGLRASASCAVLVGPSDAGDWEREEWRVALNRAATNRAFRIFLVLLPGVPEPFDVNALSPFLSTRTWVDFRKGFESARQFQALVNAIKGVPAGQPEVVAADGVCPYRGLQTFDEQHAEFFFGRDADIQRLVEKLKGTRFVIVLGASGSGKSSLVRAGLVPALRSGALPGSHAWPIHVLTPGSLPLTRLAAELVRSGAASSLPDMLDRLAADRRTLHLAAALATHGQAEDPRQLWVVDQFEEVFTLCSDEDERRHFLDNLLYASAIPGGPCVAVLTMRADFYARCAAYPELAARVAAQQFLVSPMDVDGVRQAIVAPAERVGLEFEEGLVDTILDAVMRQPGALPLLEHALLELWERRRGRMLTLEGYRESGGVDGAVARRADAIYDGFTPEQQAVARRILLRLKQVGDGTSDTRRRARIAELATTLAETDTVERVVRALADARLLTTSSQDLAHG